MKSKPVRVCTSIDCPERRSVCCGALPEAVSGDEGTGYYRCQGCHKEYIGGECNTGFIATKYRDKPIKVIEYCKVCNQITNHQEGKCLKHKFNWFDLAFDSLPEWIDKNYPKGNKERGKIVVILTNYLLWLKNHD